MYQMNLQLLTRPFVMTIFQFVLFLTFYYTQRLVMNE